MDNWKRYLDDGFIIWRWNAEKLNQFKTILNSLDVNITFTMEVSNEQISFLDVLIIKREEKIYTDIYYKPTDSHQYLNFSSCHPRAVKRAIPYNLARRICVICSDLSTRLNRLEELKTILSKQGYPVSLINDGISNALKLNRSLLLQTKHKSKSDSDSIIPFVHTYNPKNTNVLPVLSHTNSILQNDEKTKDIFRDNKFINSRRQSKNLKHILCPSKFITRQEIPMVKRCKDSRCGTCEVLLEGCEYNFNGTIFKIQTSMTCSTQNVIYVLTCMGCNQFYIGETGNTLRERTRIHKEQICHPQYRKIRVSGHIDTCGKRKFKIFPFYKVRCDDSILRRCKERFFIDKFHPTLNNL